MNKKKKSFFITAWNRDQILLNTISSLINADRYDEYDKFIIYQDCTENKKNEIFKIDPNIKIIEKFYPESLPVYKKLYFNLYSGFEYAFEKLNSSFSIHIEDDILVSKNLFIFYENIIEKYYKDKKFFAVNGMSKEFANKEFDNTYSKFIWGICKCWGLHNSRWPILKKIWHDYYSSEINSSFVSAHDSPIEHYIKKNINYVIMPYRSLILEQLSNGCNSVNDPNYPGFKEWCMSFYNKKKITEFNYSDKMIYTWRDDCIKYNLKNILYLKIYYFLNKILPVKFKKNLKKLLNSLNIINRHK